MLMFVFNTPVKMIIATYSVAIFRLQETQGYLYYPFLDIKLNVIVKQPNPIAAKFVKT